MSDLACERCKFWEQHDPDPWYFADDEERVEKLARDVEDGKLNPGDTFADWGTCKRPREAGSRFYAQDSSDYNAWLVTRKDFWCAEWSAKSEGEGEA